MKKRRQIAIINGFIPAPSGRKAAGFFPQRVQPLTDGKGKKTDESRRKTHEFLRKTDEFPRRTDEFPRKTHEFPGKTVEFLRKTHEFPGKTDVAEHSPLHYRRRKSSLSWHWRKDCPRWPVTNYIEDWPRSISGTEDHTPPVYLLCPFCRQLEGADRGKPGKPDNIKPFKIQTTN